MHLLRAAVEVPDQAVPESHLVTGNPVPSDESRAVLLRRSVFMVLHLVDNVPHMQSRKGISKGIWIQQALRCLRVLHKKQTGEV